MIDTSTTTNVTPSVVTCRHCKQVVPERDAWLVHLIEPSGRFKNGREVWRVTGEQAHVCKQCIFQEETDTEPLPERLQLAEDGEWETPSWSHNSNGDDDEFITYGWQARTYEGRPAFKHKEKAAVQAWLADHGYTDTGDGHHYERK